MDHNIVYLFNDFVELTDKDCPNYLVPGDLLCVSHYFLQEMDFEKFYLCVCFYGEEVLELTVTRQQAEIILHRECAMYVCHLLGFMFYTPQS